MCRISVVFSLLIDWIHWSEATSWPIEWKIGEKWSKCNKKWVLNLSSLFLLCFDCLCMWVKWKEIIFYSEWNRREIWVFSEKIIKILLCSIWWWNEELIVKGSTITFWERQLLTCILFVQESVMNMYAGAAVMLTGKNTWILYPLVICLPVCH